jgi:hypothetical protein
MKYPALGSLLLLISNPWNAPAAPARHPVYEPGPLQSAAAAANLFDGARVTASGHWSDRVPAFAVDGRSSDPGNHWACEKLPVWLTVDLGTPRSLSSLHVWPYWGDGRIYQYKVEGSSDGQSWTMLADHTANSIASTAEGDRFTFTARTTRYVRTTFTHNSRGAGIGGHLVEIAGYATPPRAGLQGATGSVNRRYGQAERPAGGGREIALTAWRGERVSAQLLLWSDQPASQLRVSAPPLAGAAPAFNFVRATLADGKPQPDILDDAPELELAAGQVRSVWMTLDVPADAKPGVHRGAVTARAAGLPPLEFPVALEVLPATLPPPSAWRVHLDLWQHPQAVARWHDVTAWSPEHLSLMKPLMQRLARAGQKAITCAIIHEPWNAQTYDWFPSMIDWRKKADGTWSYDYTLFDRWVTFMMDEVGITQQISCYTMIPWSLNFRYFDEAQQAAVDLKLEPASAEYDQFWGRFLKDFVQHLRTRGWLDRTAIAMDERPDHLMKPALAVLARHAPELKIVSAANHPTDLTKDLYDLSVSIDQVDRLDAALLAARKAAGQKTTYYVCCGPARPNTFTFSPPAEAAWLGWLAAARGCDGVLRWAYNSWVENPLQSTDFTSWPSGDTSLVYPGNRSPTAALNSTAWSTRPAPTCCSTPTTRWTGTPGATRPSRRARRRTSRSSSPSATPPATGAT